MIRASDTEREQAVEVLRLAAGEGRLTTEELEQRLHAAYGAATQAELATLTGDLPAAPPARAAPATDRQRRRTAVAVFGGSTIDLGDGACADLADLRVIAAFGGSKVIVPEGLNVQVSEFALFGGNSVRVGETTPDPGGPVLRIRLISVFGGSTVKRRRGTTSP